MALKEQLDKFKRQQEKCTMLFSITPSRQGPSGPSSVPAAIQAPIKFSNDTNRLQNINNIRKAPVGAQIKRVIDLLFETREAFTLEQINERCYVDMNANKAVFDSMRNNPKVHFDGRRFSYKAKHDVKDKSQLLSLVKKFPVGIAAVDLKDAYPNVMEDLQALKASRHIWFLSNADSQEDIVYPNDFNVKIQVDEDLKSLFRDVDIPSDILDVEKELQKFGLKPVMNTAQRRVAAQIHGMSNKPKQKKKKEISKRTKLTNAHLPELFQHLNPNSSRN